MKSFLEVCFSFKLLQISGFRYTFHFEIDLFGLAFSPQSLLNISLQRITIPEIKNHPWFLKNLPVEMMEGGSWQCNDINNPSQSVEEVLSIIQEARKPISVPNASRPLIGSSSMDVDDFEAYVEDIETSGDFVLPNGSN